MPGLGRRITRGIIDPDSRSPAAWLRGRRFEHLLRRHPDLAGLRVLDLGGEVHTWSTAPVRPRHVTLLNLAWKAELQHERIEADGAGDWLSAVAGDACDPPAAVRDERFDLVFSNSVIEHVGGHGPRRYFAHWAQTLGEHHWIQTPNRWFPVEPHWLCPGVHFLPARAQAAVLKRWPIGSFTPRHAPLEERMLEAMGIELLSETQLRCYFPHSEILHERVGPLVKSLIATG